MVPLDVVLRRVGDYGRACAAAERLSVAAGLMPTLGGEAQQMDRAARAEVARLGDEVARMLAEYRAAAVAGGAP
jgi:hypothetical protein